MSDEMQEDGEINYARSIFASMGETYSSRCPARPRQWRLSPDLVQRPHHRLLRTRAEPGASGRVADHGHRVEWPASDQRSGQYRYRLHALFFPVRPSSFFLEVLMKNTRPIRGMTTIASFLGHFHSYYPLRISSSL